MTTFLLDVNVLIALIDVLHVHHNVAHDWFEKQGQRSWATCPLTENGVVRIVGHQRYPKPFGPPSAVVPHIAKLCTLPGHIFWPDDISILETQRFDQGRLLNSEQVTDSYLLGLARAHNGKLASLDRRLVATAVIGGAEALHLIE
ncbi:MAG: VapC toxin family PIN domain ribonuclease [Alphaproteobacteria bacterium]|nr:VapC toxin family PIN domain ribonuclease [Alphaproteobacteria bacterium]